MAVRIRLTRIGRIHRPFYRIGAYDSRTRRDGECLEYLGYYDPMETTGMRLKLDKGRTEHWLAAGALPTETVASFLRELEIGYKHADRKRARNKSHSRSRQASRKSKKSSAKSSG